MSHLVIAGTGRAGTTHLVSWLADRGVDCGELGEVDEHSGGGHEHRLIADPALPYVVKDPWLYTYLHEVNPAWIDALVVPIRDLHDAAKSRVRVEQEAIQRRNPGWPHAHWGATPGGMVHDVRIDAQANVLAVGLYELIQWATANDVRLVLLDFGRIGDDGYLRAQLGEWLPNLQECETCGTSVADELVHAVVVAFDDDEALGLESGGTLGRADFCAEHCPGGCRQGCPVGG